MADSNTVPLEAIFAAWQYTSKKFVWHAKEIGKVADLVAATIVAIAPDVPLTTYQPICRGNNSSGFIYKVRFFNTDEEGYPPFLETLGCFFLTTNVLSTLDDAFFFLYIGEDRIIGSSGQPVTTLYQRFQKMYAWIAGADSGNMGDFQYDRWFGFRFQTCKPRHFSSLAKRAINRRRKVDLRTRIRILSRDRSTCQVCGRSAPDVKVDVDHRVPVVNNSSGKSDNSDANLWTLCEECNWGKSNLPFFTEL